MGASEKTFVDINGTRQGMLIQSTNDRNPVLLYLHGGIPDVFLTQRYPTGMGDLFTVAWWEQRGSGISYRPDIPPESMTLEHFLADTLAMTNHLRNRFGREKVYLMGHSGGSFVAIQAAARTPELYSAYIGVAQMSNQLRSEKLAYDFMLEQFRKNHDRRMVRRLEAAPVTMTSGLPPAYRAVRDVAMHRLGIGTTHDMHSIVTGLILPSLMFRGYTVSEKINLWRAKARSGVSPLLDEMLATDLAEKVPELEIPVYFVEGKFDYTCCYSEARAYFRTLKAPLKGFYTFEESAHSPMFEEPAKMRRILRDDVLAGRNSLSDDAIRGGSALRDVAVGRQGR